MTIRMYLERYAARENLRMHMPGHKGKGYPLDITEIEPEGLGDITAVLEESDAAVARAYGASHARMLTGGSTLGLLAALLAVSDGRVILPKASHKSLYSGCVLSRREPVFLETVYADGLPVPPAARQYAEAVERVPDAAAVVVTSPDYFGRTVDLAAVRQAVGDRALIVDAAHGAHFGLRPELPAFPVEADIVVVSSHKTLPACTQTAIVFVRESYVESFDAALGLLATTSPSYPLLASVEDAVAETAATDVTALIRAADSIPARVPSDDPLRIVIDAKALGSDGRTLQAHLARAGIEIEFATERHCVLIGSCRDTAEEYARIAEAAAAVPTTAEIAERNEPPALERVEPFLARCDTEYVDAETAVGRVLAAEVGLYPPCIPTGVRGERVTGEFVTALAGRTTFGLAHGYPVRK